MKLVTGLAFSVALAFSGVETTRPEPFLKKGNTINFILSGKGEAGETYNAPLTLTIVNVVEKQGTSVTSGIMTYYNEKHDIKSMYRMDYSCDSARFYASTLNWCYRSAANDPNVFYEDKGDSLEYPLKMSVGDSLRGGYAVHKISTKQNSAMTRYDFTTRKVISLDTIDTPFGKIAAYLITGNATITTKAKYSGAGEGQGFNHTFKVSEWFSPSIGIVKSEYSTGPMFNRCVMESYGK